MWYGKNQNPEFNQHLKSRDSNWNIVRLKGEKQSCRERNRCNFETSFNRRWQWITLSYGNSYLKNEVLEPKSHPLSCINESEYLFLFLKVAQRKSQQAYWEFCKDSSTKYWRKRLPWKVNLISQRGWVSSHFPRRQMKAMKSFQRCHSQNCP